MRFPTSIFIVGVVWAVFGLASADASALLFTAITDTGETASFILNTTVPNTYDPILYPQVSGRGVYLNAVSDLTLDGTRIALSDVTTTAATTGDGRRAALNRDGSRPAVRY